MLEAEPGLRTAEAMAFRGAGRFPPSMPRLEAVKNAGTVNDGALTAPADPRAIFEVRIELEGGETPPKDLKGMERFLYSTLLHFLKVM